MEEISDGEDFVPSTPKCQSKKALNLISKPNSKVIKNHKRKKISGLSPDFKKVKSKCKQVSLLNYMRKNKTTDESSSKLSASSENGNANLLEKSFDNMNLKLENKKTNSDNLDSVSNIKPKESTLFKPVKVDLMKKFVSLDSDSYDTKKVFDDPNKSPINNGSEKKLISSDLFHKDKVLNSCNLSERSNINLINFMNGSNKCQASLSEIKAIDTAEDVLSSAAKICPDVENLKINNFDHGSNIISQHMRENEISSIDDSFTWEQDLDWENETLKEKNSPLKLDNHENISNVTEYSQKNTYIFKVIEVDTRRIPQEICLLLKGTDSQLKTCILRGFWVDTLVNIDDVVHVIKPFENGIAVIDNNDGFLVVNPDFLLSSTAIVSTLFCMRKAALNHILPNWSSGNKVMMIGNLVHDIYQQSVNNGLSTVEEIIEVLNRVLTKSENLLALASQSMSFDEIEEKVKEYIPSIVQWMKRHVSLKGRTALENLQITCVEGIEDNIWCPKYGIKGKIDMTVQTLFRDQHKTKLLPLELKTGRPPRTEHAEHVGQVNLYTLMMEERTKEASKGLLLYLKDASNMKLVEANHNSRRGLIQLRNELSFYTYKWFVSPQLNNSDIEHCHLPATINRKEICQKCQYLLPCTIYQRAFLEDKNMDPNHAMVSLIPSATDHLAAQHLEYFIHWSNLLLLESTSSVVSNAFWTDDPLSREKKGLCVSWMILKDSSTHNKLDEKYFIHTFVRSPDSPIHDKSLNIGLTIGDYVAVSNQDNPDEVAISMGYVFESGDDFIEVGMDRSLLTVSHYKTSKFRIDKQISNSATACIRNNLMLLMSNDQQSERLRKLIIDKQEPNFLKSLSKNVILLGRPILKLLNKIQQKAVLKALMAEDYLLIRGMPGTGKTSTIVALVRLLVKIGVSVLLTSYTHSAVDNILLKLKEHIPFVRIGSKTRIHVGIKEFSFEFLTKNFKTVEEYKIFMEDQMVVATTCLGINHPIFSVRKFDVCIVDEASQINQIACLGPLFKSKKFILVGDDKQLPPLVINEKAKNKGMEESLFQRLGDSANCIDLIIQYRMNKEIMRLCNEITYGGILQCGSESVEQAVLQLSIQDDFKQQIPCWISTVLSCDLLNSFIFVNTTELPDLPSEGHGQEINEVEANIVECILKCLLNSNILSKDVGVISPYRRQADLIKRKTKNLKISEIEINTVDQFQGRDKDIIIISSVKTKDPLSEHKKSGNILNDEKRLNVAITRARKKLIIIGSISSLIHFKPFQDVISHLRKEQIINLCPKDLPL